MHYSVQKVLGDVLSHARSVLALVSSAVGVVPAGTFFVATVC